MVQVWVVLSVLPQVVAVMRKGHSLVMRRMVSGVCAGVFEGEGLGGGLAGADLAEVEDGLAGDDVAGDGEGGGAGAVAFDVAEAVDGGGAVGGCGLGEESAGDVAVGEGEEGDGELAGCVGCESGARWTREDELTWEGDIEGEGFGGEVVDGELARGAEGGGGSWAVVCLVGKDLETGVFGGVGACEGNGVGGGTEEILCGGIDSDGGDAGARNESGEEEAVGGGSEFGEEAGGGAEDGGDKSGEGGVAGAGGVTGDVGVVVCVGGYGCGGGVAVLAAEVGGVDECGAGCVEAFDESVLQAAGGGGLNDRGGRDGEGCAEDASGEEDGVCGSGDAGDREAAGAGEGDEDWIQVLIELADEGVCGARCAGERCA